MSVWIHVNDLHVTSSTGSNIGTLIVCTYATPTKKSSGHMCEDRERSVLLHQVRTHDRTPIQQQMQVKCFHNVQHYTTLASCVGIGDVYLAICKVVGLRPTNNFCIGCLNIACNIVRHVHVGSCMSPTATLRVRKHMKIVQCSGGVVPTLIRNNCGKRGAGFARFWRQKRTAA